MDEDERPWSRLTRRGYLAGAAVIGSALAGCTGSGGTGSNNGSAGTSANGTGTASGSGGSYSVTMSPVGTVEFDSVPQNALVLYPQYADMAVALGHGSAVNSIFVPEMSGTLMNHYYDRLQGVSFDWQGLSDPLGDGLTKEELYNFGSDVHFLDPAWVSTQNGWESADIDEIRNNVGPWFGNFFSGTHAQPPAGYRGDYQYYSLWELFGKVAGVFRERERYRRLNAVHEDLLATIQADLPPEDERPSAVRVTLNAEQSQFYTYHLNKPGYWLADTRPLGAIDAFADQNWSDLWGTVGYEAMAEADPDVILHLWGLTPDYDIRQVISDLENDPVGSQLSAVQNGRVYPQGMRYQGPIMNLFQLEMTAKQLYPDVFGEWPEYTSGDPYPEIPAEEQLFDRTRVANAVTGGNRS